APASAAIHQAAETQLQTAATSLDQEEQTWAPDRHPELVFRAQVQAVGDLKSYAALNDQYLAIRDSATYCEWMAAGMPGQTAFPSKDGKINLDTPNPKLVELEKIQEQHDLRIRNLASGDGAGEVNLPAQVQIPSNGSGGAK